MLNFDNRLIQTVFSFNYTDIRDISLDELIDRGLKIYIELSKCINASIFLLNKNNFEFNFYASTNFDLAQKINELFEDFTEDGTISDAIVHSKSIERDVLSDSKQYFYLLIPLTIPNGIIGIVMLRFDSSIAAEDHLKFYLNGFSLNFALLVDKKLILQEQIQLTSDKPGGHLLEQLKTEISILNSLLDYINSGLIIVDKSTSKVILGNDYACNLIGISKELIIDSKLSNHFLIHTSSKPLENQQQIYEGLIHKSDGVLVPVLMKASHLEFHNLNIVAYSFVDNSEIKKIENELQKTRFLLEQRVEVRTEELTDFNLRLQQEIKERQNAESQLLKFLWMIEQSPTAILIIELDGFIKYANKKYYDLTGYSPNEVIGHLPNFWKLEDIKVVDILKQIRKSNNWWKSELQNFRMDGSSFWTSLSISPVSDLDGTLTNFLCVQEDITEKKQVMDELILAKKTAEESSNFKTSILNNMSHEFRTPLIGVLGFTQLLLHDLENKEHVSMIEIIDQSGKRLLKTLDELLQLSDIESRKVFMKPVKTNFKEIVNSLTKKYKSQIEKKGLEFVIQINYEEILFYSDQELLQIVLDHLLDNAIRFTNTGKIVLSTEVVNEPNNKSFRINIIDTGIGIAQDKLEYILEPFRQADEGLTRRYEGTGLGLTVSKRLINILEGKLSINSKINEGSEFIIDLPIIPTTFSTQLSHS